MTFSPTFFALQEEASLTRSSLAIGLTEIRNANIGERGRYYTGFFQLSIALERFIKLNLVLHHMVANSLTPPGANSVRMLGHDLQALYAASQQIVLDRGLSCEIAFPTHDISVHILEHLSEFAQRTRYAKLDALASGRPGRDPLAEWHDILIEIVEMDIPKKRRETVAKQAQAIAQEIQETVLIRSHDLTNRPLSAQAWLAQPQLYAAAARYAAWYYFELFVPLKDLVVELGKLATDLNLASDPYNVHIPYMSDFFDFLWAPKRLVLSKKKWP